MFGTNQSDTTKRNKGYTTQLKFLKYDKKLACMKLYIKSAITVCNIHKVNNCWPSLSGPGIISVPHLMSTTSSFWTMVSSTSIAFELYENACPISERKLWIFYWWGKKNSICPTSNNCHMIYTLTTWGNRTYICPFLGVTSAKGAGTVYHLLLHCIFATRMWLN